MSLQYIQYCCSTCRYLFATVLVYTRTIHHSQSTKKHRRLRRSMQGQNWHRRCAQILTTITIELLHCTYCTATRVYSNTCCQRYMLLHFYADIAAAGRHNCGNSTHHNQWYHAYIHKDWEEKTNTPTKNKRKKRLATHATSTNKQSASFTFFFAPTLQ